MRRKMMAIIMGVSMAFAVTACGQRSEEEMPTLLAEGEEGAAYAIATAAYGNIVKKAVIPCTYTSTEEQSLAFGVDGRLIEQVNVKIGDYVVAGQLLAALDVQDLEEKIEDTEFQIKRQELKLRQTEEMKQFDMDSAVTLFDYTAEIEDEEDVKEKKADIEKEYKTSLEDISDSIFILQQRLQQYRDELEEGCLFSDITGEVTYVESGMEGTYCKKDKNMIRISNMDACYFVADDIEYAPLFEKGEPVTITCKTPGETFDCEAVFVLLEGEDEALYFKPLGDEIISANVSGSITLELERRENVLCIPVSALHESDRGPFVYLVNDGLLEMRYVTVGAKDDLSVEITDGLTQGETVALTR